MVKKNFYNQGQSLIGIIIVLVIVGLLSGGFYFYLQKQILEAPEIIEVIEKPAEKVVKPEEEVITPPVEEELPEEIVPLSEEKIVIEKPADDEVIKPRRELPKKEVPCQNKFKMAFILLAKDKAELSSERIDKLNLIKKYFSNDFHTATQNIGYMDTSYKVVTVVDDGSLVSQNYIMKAEVAKKFYKDNPDEFDFITIYTTFEPLNYMSHTTVKNNIEGIGRSIFDNSELYGSDSVLLGVNFMRNIDMYIDPNPDTFRSSGLLHETGHQWCCYVGDNYDYRHKRSNLPILDRNIHWHCPLQVDDYDTAQNDPMGGCYWIDNRDGTFTRKDIKPKVPIYHKLTLYLMGLVPKEQVPDIKLILLEQDPPSWHLYEPLKASVKYITINDIIARYGEVSCKEL